MEKKTIRKGVWGSRKPAPIDLASILNQPGQQTSPAYSARSAAVSRAGGTSRGNDTCTGHSEKFEAAGSLSISAAGALTPAPGRAPSSTSIESGVQVRIHPGEWITTATAAKLTGYSRRQIHALCDHGFFIEGREWRQRPPCPGHRAGGWIWLRRSALKKLETA